MINNYATLSAALKEIALKNCEGTLTVVKQVRGLDGTLRPGQDWTFTSSTSGVSPATGRTDENGALNHDVSFSGGADTRPVTITETQQDLHRLEQQSGKNAVCTNRSTGKVMTVTNSGGLGFSVDVPRDGAISCTLINAQYETYEDLAVTHTSTLAYDRDYDWSLVKDVDRTEAKVIAGTEASFDYSGVVTPTAAQDSNFRLRGVVTVQNPNPSPISGVTVTDVVPGADCTVVKGSSLTVPARGQSLVAYTCEFPSEPATSTTDSTTTTATTTATNTATVTWNAAAHHGSTGQATTGHTIDFGAVQPSTTDAVVTVSDDLLGLEESVRAVDGAQRFDYSLAFEGVAGTCVAHTNTASLDSDDGESLSDAETVVVCAPQWDLAKTSDPASGSEVEVGETITYTLTAANRGTAEVAEAVVIDDLSTVLDHASLVDQSIEASAGEVAVEGNTLTWTMTDLSGTQTVSYQVRVDDDAWGVTLRNSATGVGAHCDPVADAAARAAGESAGEDCPPVTTEHHTPKQPEPTPSPSTPTPGTPVEAAEPTPAADPQTGDRDPAGGTSVSDAGPEGVRALASTGAGAGLLALLGIGVVAVLAGGWLVLRRRFGQQGA